ASRSGSASCPTWPKRSRRRSTGPRKRPRPIGRLRRAGPGTIAAHRGLRGVTSTSSADPGEPCDRVTHVPVQVEMGVHGRPPMIWTTSLGRIRMHRTWIATPRPRPAVKWHGGKHYLARRILARLPAHRRYVEPFAGGLSVLLNKRPASVEVAADLHPGLI